jgi:hypothetical protein
MERDGICSSQNSRILHRAGGMRGGMVGIHLEAGFRPCKNNGLPVSKISIRITSMKILNSALQV